MYQEFIETLKQHERGCMTIEDMNQTIKEMLLPYPELSQKFSLFVSPTADRELPAT